MAFDVDGLLFVTAENPSGYWNLWGNSADNYSLWESVGSYNYPIEESGNLTLTATPESSTWAMMLIGFAGVGFAGYRTTWRTAAAHSIASAGITSLQLTSPSAGPLCHSAAWDLEFPRPVLPLLTWNSQCALMLPRSGGTW